MNLLISVAHQVKILSLIFVTRKAEAVRFHDHSKSQFGNILTTALQLFPFLLWAFSTSVLPPLHQFLPFPFTLCLSATGTSLIQLVLVQDVLLGKRYEPSETGDVRFYCTSLKGRHGDFVLDLAPLESRGPWIFRHLNWLWCEVLRPFCGHLSKTWLNWILFNAVLYLWPCWEDLEGLSAQ